MPITVTKNELPRTKQRPVADKVVSALAGAEGDWKVSLISDAANNGWDVEVTGPDKFQWARRFSGDDRDPEVIAVAVQAAVEESGHLTTSPPPELNDALSSLAIQGIAFTKALENSGDRRYTVDRVQLKESEIVYLHNQGALTLHGIRAYLLTRQAA